MIKDYKLEERKPIWIALSEFYLDTELQESDYQHIATIIIESPYSIKEVKEINKYEVFPVLQMNLMSVAGEWAGFEEEWLVRNIQDSIASRNAIKKLAIEGAYKNCNGMCKDHWLRIEEKYAEL